jgi:hypothetical protein
MGASRHSTHCNSLQSEPRAPTSLKSGAEASSVGACASSITNFVIYRHNNKTGDYTTTVSCARRHVSAMTRGAELNVSLQDRPWLLGSSPRSSSTPCSVSSSSSTWSEAGRAGPTRMRPSSG